MIRRQERHIMKLAIKIIVGTAIVVASVAAATFGASAPAAAGEQILRMQGATPALTDVSTRKRVAKKKKYGNTSVRVVKLSARASLPPNANRPYYRPVPTFYPFGQRRGYF